MLTGFAQIFWCFDWEDILSQNHLIQDFFCPQYFFKFQFTLLGSFIHCQNWYTWSKISFLEMQADHPLRFGSIGLFFRTPKLLSLYFSKLISCENNAEGNVAEVLSYFYHDLLILSCYFLFFFKQKINISESGAFCSQWKCSKCNHKILLGCHCLFRPSSQRSLLTVRDQRSQPATAPDSQWMKECIRICGRLEAGLCSLYPTALGAQL